MKTIWKFELKVDGRQEIDLPEGAQIMSVQEQHGSLCLWAMCEHGAIPKRRTIRIYGTGHAVSDADRLTFIGTVQMRGGVLVWHVFEQA